MISFSFLDSVSNPTVLAQPEILQKNYLDSVHTLLKHLMPLIENSLSKPWYFDIIPSWLGTILIPVAIFFFGNYVQKVREYNKMIMQLQSYKSYSFNCIELIHASARAQAKYIDQYLIQFDKYELKERLTAVPNYPALIFNRLDFSKFFSSCVEYTTFDVSKSSDFKELQDNLSLVTAVIEQVVPVKNMFTDKYKEVQHNVVDGLNKLNEIGTNFRGKSGVHSFLREVCEEIVKYNKTAKEVDLSGKENYYIYPDKIEKLCSGMIGVCEKYVFDFEVDNERIRVEIIATNLSNDIANLQSLFDQYMDVFKSMSKNLENTSVKIRSQCEKMSSHCLILKEYFGRKKVLKPIVLEFK